MTISEVSSKDKKKHGKDYYEREDLRCSNAVSLPFAKALVEADLQS